MKLGDVPFPSKVKLYIGPYDNVIGIGFDPIKSPTITGMALGKLNGLVLLAWKKGEEYDQSAWDWHGVSGVDLVVANPDYEKGFWIPCEYEIAGIIKDEGRGGGTAIAPSMDGIACRRCQEFFPYAVANRPDGVSLICYSCRQGFIPAGW